MPFLVFPRLSTPWWHHSSWARIHMQQSMAFQFTLRIKRLFNNSHRNHYSNSSNIKAVATAAMDGVDSFCFTTLHYYTLGIGLALLSLIYIFTYSRCDDTGIVWSNYMFFPDCSYVLFHLLFFVYCIKAEGAKMWCCAESMSVLMSFCLQWQNPAYPSAQPHLHSFPTNKIEHGSSAQVSAVPIPMPSNIRTTWTT